jgi:hypothetical protein
MPDACQNRDVCLRYECNAAHHLLPANGDLDSRGS